MVCAVGCAGPGLEPPGDQASAGVSGGSLGGGTGGAGYEPVAGAGGGWSNPDAGASGMGGLPPAGAGGVGGVVGGAGTDGAGTGGVAGTSMGGAGGVGGMDATGEPGRAPERDCEEGREVVELHAVGSPSPTCATVAPGDTLVEDGAFSVAITTTTQDASAQTTWAERKDDGQQCGEQAAFYINNSLGLPRLVLCPTLCEAVLAAQASGDVTVEVIYGCEPPP